MASVEVVRCRGLRRALLLWRADFPSRGKFVFQRRNTSSPKEERDTLAKKSAGKQGAQACLPPMQYQNFFLSLRQEKPLEGS